VDYQDSTTCAGGLPSILLLRATTLCSSPPDILSFKDNLGSKPRLQTGGRWQ
jgi:hypothetical protein